MPEVDFEDVLKKRGRMFSHEIRYARPVGQGGGRQRAKMRRTPPKLLFLKTADEIKWNNREAI